MTRQNPPLEHRSLAGRGSVSAQRMATLQRIEMVALPEDIVGRPSGPARSAPAGRRPVIVDAAISPPGGADALDVEWCYRTYAPKIRAFVAPYVGDADLADEIVQKTFVRVAEFRHAFDPRRSVWPWLSRIAIRVCSNTLRANALRAARSAGAAVGVAHGPLVAIDPAERHLAQQGDLLGALPARYRDVLLLKHVLGLRYDEIAALARLRRSGVHALLVRARKKLRQAVRERDAAACRFPRTAEEPIRPPARPAIRERAPPAPPGGAEGRTR